MSNVKENKLKTYNNLLYEYVDPDELSSIIGKVRRERQNKKDDILLSQYCYNQINNYLTPSTHDKPNSETNHIKDNETRPVEDVEPMNRKASTEYIDVTPAKNVHSIPSSNAPSCLCNCTPAKRPDMEGSCVDLEHDGNSVTTSVARDRARSLGYSNITMVSSYRDGGQGHNDGSDTNREKVKTVRLKIKRLLDTITSNVDTFKSPEDDTEKEQLKQKAVEFCGRFSRNHLYEIGRALNETTKALNYCLPYNQWKHVTSQSKSILNVHQVLLQAFSMFQRHMRIVWGYGDTHEKLHTLLQFTLEVNRICLPLLDKTDCTFSDLQNGCDKLIELLNNIFADDNKSCTSKSTLYYKEVMSGLGPKKMVVASSRISTDLSYLHMQPIKWTGIGNTNSMAGDRYSMYRQQIVRKMPPARKAPRDVKRQRNANTIPVKKSKSLHAVRNSSDSNNMRVVSQKESRSCHQLCPPTLQSNRRIQNVNGRRRSLPMGGRNVLHHHIKKYNDSHMEIIHPKSRLEALDECSNVSDAVSEKDGTGDHYAVREGQNDGELKTNAHCQRTSASGDAERGGVEEVLGGRVPAEGNNRAHKLESRSNSGNVLLLVVKHDESQDRSKLNNKNKPHIEAIKSEVAKENGDSNKVVKELTVKPTAKIEIVSETDFKAPTIDTSGNKIVIDIKGVNDAEQENEQPSSAKVSVQDICRRVTGGRKKLNVIISKEECDAIHNYRVGFVKGLMDNPLYVHENIRRPWEAVARISEKLIEDAIRTVAEEMEMEALLRQMVDVELQDSASVMGKRAATLTQDTL